MMMTSPQFRIALRRAYQRIREKLSVNFQDWASKQISLNIQNFALYKDARQIALYQAVRGEINLAPLWQKASEENKTSFFPILEQDKTLRFLSADPNDLFTLNRHGIREPARNKAKSRRPEQLDIIFLPLVSFDRKGTRLGMGQGYYDRTLANSKPRSLIGVAYDFQCYPNLEAQAWDIPLDFIVTPSRIYCCNKELSNSDIIVMSDI